MKKKNNKEFCCTNGHVRYAGVQLIIELWGGKSYSSVERIQTILRDAVQACGATLLDINLHKFTPSGGVSGVAVIHESHLSIHTWPEYKYAALDVFVCGEVDPYKAIPVIKKGFAPKQMQISEIKRGIF